MSYLLGGAAVIIILHIYYRIGQVHLANEKLTEQFEALDNLSRERSRVTARQTRLLDARLNNQNDFLVRIIGNGALANPSNDDGGDA